VETPNSSGRAINDAGQVVGLGYGSSSPNVFVATVWNGTTPTPLGVLPGGVPGRTTGTIAYGINNAGLIVGRTDIPNNSCPTCSTSVATIWNGTTPTALPSGTSDSAAGSINNVGQVTGGIGGDPVIWNGTNPIVLGTLGGTAGSGVGAINDLGQAVGGSYIGTGVTSVATVWSGTTAINLNDLLNQNDTSWALRWTLEVAFAINLAGQIVGRATDGFHDEAFLLTPCNTCGQPLVLPLDTPLPTALPLFATGLGALSLLGWHRKRKKTAEQTFGPLADVAESELDECRSCPSE
jgi:uncharacterized membrane protein